uniref:Protocadherin 1 gamma 22 n=1 Tax=Paramormyrops kingsleyae TaxID=1676925 RepID=A0A3B3T775_9TELE
MSANERILEWLLQWLWWLLFFPLWSTTDGQIRYTIPEELKVGSVVGNLAKDLGLDVREMYDRKLRIASEAGKQYFSVDLGKGELAVRGRIDREILCEQSVPCLLPFEVVIENPLQLFPIEIEIQDINDNVPSFSAAERILKISELVSPGAKFILENARDADVGANSLRSYSISKTEHFKLNVKTHKDGTKIPELVLEKSLDREDEPVHKLVLTAFDGGNPAQSGTSQITITVTDINDNAPQFEKASYEAVLNENTVPGSKVLQVHATDVDDGLNGEVEYLFGDQTPHEVTSLLDINSQTGEITVKGQINYEKTNLLKFDVLAKDKGNPEMEGHCSVQVEILDLNDNIPEITVTSLTSPVPEDSAVGTVIALISAKDSDSGENGKVKLSVSPNSLFQLGPSVSNHYALITNGPLDRESYAEYSIDIAASDSSPVALSSIKTVTVAISDVNDNPPVFSQPSYTVYLKENGPPGMIVCSVSSSDLDIGDNAKISYSILDSKVQDLSVSSYVYINADNGSIYSMQSFDYEKLKVFKILVQAKDQGSPSLSSNVTVHVFILDENDNVPTVIYPSVIMGSTSHQKLPRSAKAGHLVTKVTAVDADSGHNAWISYKLVEATDASLFSVNLYTGEVRTKRAVSDQDDSSHRLLIEIKDNGEPMQSTTVTVGISLEDGFQEPILDLQHEQHEPTNKDGKITFYLIIALASISAVSLLTFLILTVKCVRNGRRSCLSPMSEFSDLTLIKPSSTMDFKEMVNVIDASLPDSAWTFESQQVSFACFRIHTSPDENTHLSIYYI